MLVLPDRLRLPFRFDAAALAAEIAALGDGAWLAHFNTQYYEGDWSGVALRTPGGKIGLYPDPNPSEPYAPTAHLAACERFRAALQTLRCPITSARVLRLGPGARIREHRDYRIGLEFGEVRLHVPLVTGPQVEFILNGLPLAAAPGECWYVDVTQPHRLTNNGSIARLHLVLDCVLDPWLEEVLREAARSPFERMQALVDSNPAVAEALWKEIDRTAFVARTVELAAAHGIVLGPGEVESALAHGMVRWFDAANG
jgi:hypothetical protein